MEGEIEVTADTSKLAANQNGKNNFSVPIPRFFNLQVAVVNFKIEKGFYNVNNELMECVSTENFINFRLEGKEIFPEGHYSSINEVYTTINDKMMEMFKQLQVKDNSLTLKAIPILYEKNGYIYLERGTHIHSKSKKLVTSYIKLPVALATVLGCGGGDCSGTSSSNNRFSVFTRTDSEKIKPSLTLASRQEVWIYTSICEEPLLKIKLNDETYTQTEIANYKFIRAFGNSAKKARIFFTDENGDVIQTTGHTLLTLKMKYTDDAFE